MESQPTAVLRKNLGNMKNKDMTLSKFLNKPPYVSYGKRGYKQAFFKKKKKYIYFCLLNLLAEA